MRFANPLYFLLFIPAVLFIFLYFKYRIGREAVLRFSNVELVKKSGGRKLSFGRLFTGLLRLLCFVFLILAIARPQTGTGEDKTSQQVVDIMLSLDVSGSMATLDFQPDNRLTVAKREAARFIEGRKNDRIGLVIFSGQSFTQCPLTVDHQAITALLEKIQLGTMQDGTAIGLGLGNAVNRLKNSEAKSKVIILLTDGVNNAGEIDPLTAADLAKQLKIKVYTVGVGREGTALLPIQDPNFGTRFMKVETQIDEKALDQIARRTGGQYFRAQDERGLRDIFHAIDQLEKTEIKVERFTHYDEQYFWFLWPALFILLGELIWTNLIFVKIP